MTPPISSTPPPIPSVLDSSTPSSVRPPPEDLLRAQPLLDLRPEIRNPFRSRRPIQTLGDIGKAVTEDFVRDILGASAAQRLGSFPGWLSPHRSITGWWEEVGGNKVHRRWTPDEKPDVNAIGDAAAMLRRMAPRMGWDAETLEANIERAREGMVYFNVALETRAGPVPIKLGIIDSQVLFNGEPYFSLRASLLPETGTYEFFADASPEFQTQFNQWVRENKANYLEHTLDSFLFSPRFSAQDLVNRRFFLQFAYYEGIYRGFFEFNKGGKQARRMQGVMPEILVPAIQSYLERNNDLKVYHPGHPGVELSPREITVENFHDLNFVLERSFPQRLKSMLGLVPNFFFTNGRMARQTFRNIASNGTRREGYHDVNWFRYGLRKFQRLFGINGERNVPRAYSPEASQFSSDAARLGRVATPLRAMGILAGYDAGGWNDPRVFQEVLRYAVAEMGSIPNPLFKGVDPSKFTLPIRGVSSVAYQMMNALESDAVQHFLLAGTEDTKVVFDRFVEFYAEDILHRGKNFHFVPMGNSFTANLRKVVEGMNLKGENVAISFGDNPLIDMERILHHPERHLVDWIVAANSRSRLQHDGGKNYHADGYHEGVHDPSKEGNAYSYPGDSAKVPWQFLQAIFDSRKSMGDGPGKFGIVMRMLFGPFNKNPLSLIDSLHWMGTFIPRLAWLQFQQRVLGRRVPSFPLPMEISEKTLQSRLGLRSSLFPNHGDPGGVLDIDGVFDLAIAKGLMEGTDHPERIYPHWEKLAPFADALAEAKAELPALTDTPERINRLYEQIRQESLGKSPRDFSRYSGFMGPFRRFFHVIRDAIKGRPAPFTAESLRSRGFAPDIPPMLPDGSMNPAWMEIVIPEKSFQYFRQGFEAYPRRAEHAQGLDSAFHERIEATQPYAPKDRVSAEVESLVFEQLNIDPERSRSQLIEWNFSRLTDGLLEAGRKRFPVNSPQVAELERYLQMSTEGNVDTPLRRVFTGMKAVDVLRDSMQHLSPEEFRTLFPRLVEAIHDAEQATPGNRGRLRGWLQFAQTTADRDYARKVGESPPVFRARSTGAHRPHSNSRPATRTVGTEVRSVDTAALLPQDIPRLADRLRIMPSRVPHLIAAASGANSRETLPLVERARMTPERLMVWYQSAEGRSFMETRGGDFRNTFRNRVREGGPGLGVGVVSLLGAEHLADMMGLDARLHGQERFMFVVGLSHLTGQTGSAVSEVFLNRSMGQPFQFVNSRLVQAGGETAVQYSLEARSSLGRQLFDSVTRHYGLQGGLLRGSWNGLKGAATLPFRAAWGMGPGLMSSAIVDRTVGEWFFEPGSRARQWLNFGSFFLPDIYRIGVGTRGPAIFGTRGMRYATRAFAVGFIADMLFLGANRVNHGAEGSATLNGIYQRANQLHDAGRSTPGRMVDGAFEMIAPSLSAWWDSVEFDGLRLVPNRFQRQAREELSQFSSSTSHQAQDLIRHSMIYGTGAQALDPAFYSQVDYGFLRSPNTLTNPQRPDGRTLPVIQIQEQLNDPQIGQRFAQMSGDEQISYLQRQFRGHRLSREEVQTVLQQLSFNRLRGDLAQLNYFELPENQTMRALFDANGNLRAGQEDVLLRVLFNGQRLGSQDVLHLRRVALALRVMELRRPGQDAADLPRFESVAQQVGILDAAGNFVPGDVHDQAQTQFETLHRPETSQGNSLGFPRPTLTQYASAPRLASLSPTTSFSARL